MNGWMHKDNMTMQKVWRYTYPVQVGNYTNLKMRIWIDYTTSLILCPFIVNIVTYLPEIDDDDYPLNLKW